MTRARDLANLLDSGGDVKAAALDNATTSLSDLSVTATASELNIMDGVTASTAELNTLDGITASTAELNLMDGVTATTTELNLLDGVTATTAELNYVDGVTSNIQTQINNISTDVVSDTTPQLGGDLDTNNHDINFGDSDKALFGDDDDLQVYTDGTYNHLYSPHNQTFLTGGGGLHLRAKNGEDSVVANTDGSVELYYDNIKKAETTSTGIDVTGTVTMDGGSTSADFSFGDNDKALFGAGNDLQIYHDGNQSWINDAGTGDLYIQSTAAAVNITNGSSRNIAQFNTSSGVATLFHDNGTTSSAKLATTSTGVSVTGTVAATSYTGDGSSLTGISSSGAYDLNGGELTLDADGDTSITADTDDRIDFKTAGNDRLSISSNGVLTITENTNRVTKVEAPDDNGGGSKVSSYWGGQEIASLEFDLTDGTANLEDSQILMRTILNGTVNTRLKLTNAGALFVDGEGGGDLRVDLRQGSAKYWSHVDNNGGFTTRDSYNQTSVSDAGVGRINTTINNNMNNTNYVANGTAGSLVGGSSDAFVLIYNYAAGGFTFGNVRAAFVDADHNAMSVHGDLA